MMSSLMRTRRRRGSRPRLVWALVGAVAAVAAVAAIVVVLTQGGRAAPRLIITRVDHVIGSTGYYATFGSWDQHVVSNQNGIFIAYSYEDDKFHNPDYWRLARSTDGGRTFRVIYDGRGDGSIIVPPALETDRAGNVYVIAPTEQSGSWLVGPTLFYAFHAANDYRTPLLRHLRIGGAGKYSTAYDPKRNLVDLLFWSYAPNVPNFFSINSRGVVRKRVVVYTAGPNALPEYPNLTTTADGTIFAGWTTVDPKLWDNGLGTQNYYDAHFLASEDGGRTWLGRDGRVTLPAVGDDTGPSFQIVNTHDPTEFISRHSHAYRGNWNVLMGLAYNGGYLSFFYGEGERRDRGTGSGPTRHESYARMNWATRTFDERISPNFGRVTGTPFSNGGGSFAQSSDGTGRLFFAGAYYRGGTERLALLVSDDHGRSWRVYARSGPLPMAAGYVNTARDLTSDGSVIGSFTLSRRHGAGAEVYFFRVT